ncbi:24205_t:CDS:2, partial [Racocetra persica]
KTAHLLRIYSILYNVFTIAEILDSLAAIAIIIAYRKTDSLTKYDVELIIINALIIFFMIYFSLIISAYAANRKVKEEKAAHSTNNASESNDPSEQKVSKDNVSPEHETPLRT